MHWDCVGLADLHWARHHMSVPSCWDQQASPGMFFPWCWHEDERARGGLTPEAAVHRICLTLLPRASHVAKCKVKGRVLCSSQWETPKSQAAKDWGSHRVLPHLHVSVSAQAHARAGKYLHVSKRVGGCLRAQLPYHTLSHRQNTVRVRGH